MDTCITGGNKNQVMAFVFIMFTLNAAYPQNSKTLVSYYDANWNKCEKQKAVYKGTKTLKGAYEEEGNSFADLSYWKLEDFYISGELQMSGWEVFNPGMARSFRDGLFVWYDKKGNVTKKTRYSFGKIISEETPKAMPSANATTPIKTLVGGDGNSPRVKKHRNVPCKHYRECQHFIPCQHPIPCWHLTPCSHVCQNAFGFFPCHANGDAMHLNHGLNHLNDGRVHLNDGPVHQYDVEEYWEE